MADRLFEAVQSQPQPSVLDRTIDLSAVRWTALGWIAVAVVAFAMRFSQLGQVALSPDEGHRAFDAWVFYRGASADPGLDPPNTAPVILLLQALAFFLFGATDVTARILPALLGAAMIFLVVGLRPFVGRPAALGTAALVALSPTLVFASRMAEPQILVAFFSLLVVVSFLHLGRPDTSDSARRGLSLATGAGLALMIGSGVTSISVLIALAVGLTLGMALDGGDGAIRRALAGLAKTPHGLLFTTAGFLIALVMLFSHLFSNLGALAGIGETVADWARLVTTTTSTTPTQFFVLALVVYEILAVVFAIVGASRTTLAPSGGLSWPFFATWFAVALLLFSFGSGRAPEYAVHIALPLVLLGGGAIGNVLASLDRHDLFHGRCAALALALVGLVISALALAVLIGRIDTAPNETQAAFEVAIVGAVVVIPLIILTAILVRGERLAGSPGQVGLVALVVALIFLGGYTMRSSLLLNFYNADNDVELLAQRTSTAAVHPMVDRLKRLSRDATVTEATVRNPTGGQGLSIAIDRNVQWPFRWYFREFPDAAVVSAGQAALSGSEIVIAPTDVGLAEAGYTPSTYYTRNRVPGAYLTPDMGAILSAIFVPTNWGDGVQYLLFRELETTAAPESIAVGLNGELAARVFPNTGPFNLLERVGPGSGRGQFSQPRGIAVSPDDGTVYVVDMGNVRVERFSETGEFIGIWGGGDGAVTFTRTEAGLGPTGLAVGPDELIYIADTWDHRIVVLDPGGRPVREFGTFGDTEDAPTADTQPGVFFGPRDVAVIGEEIFVVDTGNERIQVFGMDGTFVRSWGGYGSEPGQFIEPVGLALGADGRVYVADSGNARISVFASTGAPLMQWTVEAWMGRQFFEPYVAFGSDGNLYATSSQTGSIEVYTPDGQFLESIIEVNGESLAEPVGITSAPDASILITDTGRNAVFRYQPVPPAEQPESDAIQEATPAASPAASSVASPLATPRASPISG